MPNLPTACIVLPTYNEAGNILLLVPQLFEQARNIPSHELHVLVVDDNSPDGTADIVRGLQAQYPQLHLLLGAKQGLGEAYKRGMAHALNTLDPQYILQMDADLQHSPVMLPLFVALGEFGFDLIIGSRFVVGGSTPNFSLRRRAISRVGNAMLRYLGGLPAIQDCTSGYRLIRADILRRCDLKRLSTRGYSFQSSLLFELLRNGAKPLEVPITFPDRRHGASKLSFADQWEFLQNIFRIRFRKSEEFLTFCAVGLSGVAVNLGAYVLLTRALGLVPALASPPAIELSILSNFYLNNAYTFRNRTARSGLLKRFVKFHLIAGASGLLNYAIMLLLVALGGWDILGQLAGIACATLINYHLNSAWTWLEVGSMRPFAVERSVAGRLRAWRQKR